MAKPFFNYIITTHNKEDLIHDVLVSTLLCCGPGSQVFVVLDGCTDNTEGIVDQLTSHFQGVPVVKLYAADVHEILSINTGLRAAPQEGDGYNIILQDDVILADLNMESKIEQLYAWGKGKLGFVSFRLGGNFKPNAANSKEAVPLTDFVENAYGHGVSDAEVLLPGRFAYRTAPIKSPVCLPTKIIREIGLLNEDLAPYMHDDTELAVRLAKAGYSNGVFALRFYSDVRWGGTRNNPHPRILDVQKRNMNIIREQHGPDLDRIARSFQRKDVITFPEICSAECDAHALLQYERAKGLLPQPDSSVGGKMRRGLHRIIAGLPGRPVDRLKRSV